MVTDGQTRSNPEQPLSASTGPYILPRKDRTKSGWNIFQTEYAATDG